MSMASGQLARDRVAHGQGHRQAAAEDQTDRELLERFFRGRDETGFRALVRRHGPLVLSVCRRVLNHVQDAEDAFQATFLVLARRGGALANPELLGSWLYGVAYRIARKARAQAARRRAQEKQGASMTHAEEPLVGLAWRELRSSLDEELNLLPDKYRLPLVLCYLQGLTNEEAARRLGWPVGSISYRLARGREMLGDRMRGRHREAPAGSLALMLALGPAGGSVREGLIEATAHAALGLVQGGAGAGALASGRVAAFVGAALRGATTGLPWLNTALLLLLASAVVIGGTLLLVPPSKFSAASGQTLTTRPSSGCRAP
jgi:RNA polymerase sigma factor (sigma-70 family)